MLIVSEFNTEDGFDFLLLAFSGKFEGGGGIVDIGEGEGGGALVGGGLDELLGGEGAVPQAEVGVCVEVHGGEYRLGIE